MENILLIRLKSIGDVVFTLPAVNAVREHYPRARITFLTSRENAPLIRGFTAVDEVLALDRAAFSSGNPRQILGNGFTLLHRLRREPFTQTFDFQGYGETELLSWWSGAPDRWGIAGKPARGWMYTGTSAHLPNRHPVEWNLDLLRAAGLHPGPVGNEFALPQADLDQARDYFQARKLDAGRPTLFLQPFTSNPDKNWPLESFLEVARQWRSRGAQIIFGGGPAERAALEPAQAAGFVIAAGCPLLVSAGLVKLASVTVGGDTGLMHLAAAMNQRVVMLMHANRPGTCHPFRHPDWAVTPPAGIKVANITIRQVMDAIEKALTELPSVRAVNINDTALL